MSFYLSLHLLNGLQYMYVCIFDLADTFRFFMCRALTAV